MGGDPLPRGERVQPIRERSCDGGGSRARQRRVAVGGLAGMLVVSDLVVFFAVVWICLLIGCLVKWLLP